MTKLVASSRGFHGHSVFHRTAARSSGPTGQSRCVEVRRRSAVEEEPDSCASSPDREV